MNMLRFSPERWLAISSNLVTLSQVHLLVVQDHGKTAGLQQRVEKTGLGLVNLLETESKLFPFSPAVIGQIERFCTEVRNSDFTSSDKASVLQTLALELHLNLMSELDCQVFILIPPERRRLYEQPEPPFGTDVETRFPDAIKDIAAAGRCYALNEWTACVFHLMRVLEHGLRSLGESLGLAPDSMAHENWQNIIEQIEKKVRALEALPRSVEKSAKQQHASEACAQFRYFKNAWRNHVSHSRASYDSRDAESVWGHVKEFMQHLAK